jgi:uncharacterized protein YjiS (DUF1127 family)
MSTITLGLSARGAEKTLHGRLRAAYRAFQFYRERRAALLSLGAMDDHILKDIGIDRSEIGSAIYGLRSERRHGHEDTTS